MGVCRAACERETSDVRSWEEGPYRLHLHTCSLQAYVCPVGFLGSASGRGPTCQCRRHKRRGLDPRIHALHTGLPAAEGSSCLYFRLSQLHGALSTVSVGSWQSEPGKQVRADSLFERGSLDSSLGLCCGNMGFPPTETWTKGSRTDLSERKEHQRSSLDSPSKQVRRAQGTLTPPLQTAWT